MDRLKKCRDCDDTFDIESWNSLTDTKKEFIRKTLNFYVKPKIMSGGKTGYTVDCRCRSCKYKHEKKSRQYTFSNGKRGVKVRVKHTGPIDKLEKLMFCTLRPTHGD